MTGVLWVAIISLQVIDVWTTWYTLKNISGAYEKNPVMRWAFTLFGVVPALIIVKALAMAGIWLLNPPVVILTLVVFIYVLVCFNNWKVISDN